MALSNRDNFMLFTLVEVGCLLAWSHFSYCAYLVVLVPVPWPLQSLGLPIPAHPQSFPSAPPLTSSTHKLRTSTNYHLAPSVHFRSEEVDALCNNPTSHPLAAHHILPPWRSNPRLRLAETLASRIRLHPDVSQDCRYPILRCSEP